MNHDKLLTLTFKHTRTIKTIKTIAKYKMFQYTHLLAMI